MQATLANHMDIFDYEDLNFRKEFGKRLFLLGLKRGEPILRLAEGDELDRIKAYYLNLCDEVIIKTGPRTTYRLKGQRLALFKLVLTFPIVPQVAVGSIVREYLKNNPDKAKELIRRKFELGGGKNARGR